MLQSLRGTLDAYGIRTLRLENDEEVVCQCTRRVAEFWAVVSMDDLQDIRLALALGDRRLATHLLVESATSIGSIVPTQFMLAARSLERSDAYHR